MGVETVTWFFILFLLFLAGVAGLALAYLQGEGRARSRVRFVSTSAHGMLDYLIGLLLIGMPWLLGFAAGGAETWVPVVLGSGLVLYSLFTDYEWGAVRWIPMPYHLVLDAVSGLLLAASPFLFGFWDEVLDPHLGVGIVELGLVLVTQLHAPDAVASTSRMSSSTTKEGPTA